MKIILLDKRANFRNDIRNRLLIDDDREVELLTDLESVNGLDTAINRYHPDLLVIADNVRSERPDWTNLGVAVAGYVSRRDASDPFRALGIPTFGFTANAAALLDAVEAGVPAAHAPKTNAASPSPHVENPRTSTYTEAHVPKSDGFASAKMPELKPDMYQQVPAPQAQPQSAQQKAPAGNMPTYTAHTPSYAAPRPQQAARTVEYLQQNEIVGEASRPQEVAPEPQSVKGQMEENRRIRNDAIAAAAIQRDLNKETAKTKTVTIYAAKGGVGKTTIATELAVMLSLVSKGRSNLRVCLIDYNIDFGDVLTTLDLDVKGATLSHWSAEIRRRIAAGEAPESINYDARNIEHRLQRFKDSSLYVLVAPTAHEDSMDIESNELEIILRNIIDNGMFDFVICDTGNNTRDSTVTALYAADQVLLIATQDVSAVHCDKAFLQTMIKVGDFDTSKIRLVVNNIMPYKYTQVAVKEVEAMFPYPCIARFKRDPDVTRANNCSEPLVYEPNHEFTKEMRSIIAHLTGHKLPDEPKKFDIRSIFKRPKKKEDE